jgi:hypothetical protein
MFDLAIDAERRASFPRRSSTPASASRNHRDRHARGLHAPASRDQRQQGGAGSSGRGHAAQASTASTRREGGWFRGVLSRFDRGP